METNFDEGISDDVLRGSFLALKQLQTKGKKLGKLKKSPSTIEKEAGPRSQLYQRFKEIHGFGQVTPDTLDTPVPKSLLMYRTYREIFAEKYKKIRYIEQDKPEHPFFGNDAVLDEDFTLIETDGFSQTYQETIEEMELEGLIKKYNYNMMPDGECGYPGKFKTPVIRPLKQRKVEIGRPEDDVLTPELLESVQRILVDSDHE
ncbi:hypothetical protein GE061_007994 [Apolygus lucorum]|uniref:Uncharacterized protein n=1 Tax=Apolygus lucorum TaxID=248454 RepID=A0A6A4IXC9_APOLU|nr:hypothetical protein GE061_007994 [Apolygus lucorum]